MLRTYQPKKIQRKREHGFRKRMATRSGRRVLSNRRAKGRKRLSHWFMKFYSLTRNKDFNRVYKRGLRFSSKNFVLYLLKNKYRYARLGISASKKVGCAVSRNRVRRIVKEAFVNMESQITMDIVVVAKPSSVSLKMPDVVLEINGVIKKVLRC